MVDVVLSGRRIEQGCELKTGPFPIALFAYNRPEQTRMTLDALASNRGASESELTVFCDGPRTDADLPKIAAVRALAAQVAGFGRVRVETRPDNLGSAEAIRAGLNEMLDEHEAVIVLEDDLTTSEYFLEFVNKGLEMYANDDRVASICGYSPPGIDTPAETYFLPGAHCWGWATWRRAWNDAEQVPGKALHAVLQNDKVFELDLAGTEPCTLQLARAASGQRDSWVLPWMASAIVKEQLTLYPRHSLIRNDGLEDSGLPVGWLHLFESTLADRCPKVDLKPPVADTSAFEHVRALMMRWRCHDSRRKQLSLHLQQLLSESARRALYVSGVRRALRHMQS